MNKKHTKQSGGGAFAPSPCSTTAPSQKTKSSDSQVQIALEDVINEWRPRFPKLSSLLVHVSEYPNTLPFVERTLRRHLKPLLVQWQQGGRPEIEWPEPWEYQ